MPNQIVAIWTQTKNHILTHVTKKISNCTTTAHESSPQDCLSLCLFGLIGRAFDAASAPYLTVAAALLCRHAAQAAALAGALGVLGLWHVLAVRQHLG